MRIPLSLSFILILFLASCKSDTPNQVNLGTAPGVKSQFTLLSSEQTGIEFSNDIKEDDRHNFFTYEYIYNGGGVAVGDLNGDNLEDIYLTGNLVGDRLYLNQGDFKFKDITSEALPSVPNGWSTGVTMADVNQDGLLDIYVCRARKDMRSENLLFINKGDLKFEEQAQKFEIADNGNSVQSAFFDYDADGDLDLYVMNHPSSFKPQSVTDIQDLLNNKTAETDRLYKNEGKTFVDVTYEAGIQNHGFGLGLAVSDLNNDKFLDIYVCNDYDQPDLMYMNEKNGTFRDEVKKRTKHISQNSMGCDVADFNNDGHMDILTLDMAFPSHERSKRNMPSMSTERFWELVGVGYHLQYMSNMLQMNVGNNTYSEIAQLAGIAKTDWSWAPLFADFDNDGLKDLLVTNGFKRDIRDQDFETEMVKMIKQGKKLNFKDVLPLVPSSKVRNYLYKNNGDLTFTDVSEAWGFDELFNSNGAVYSDLDNDGDLDLVINNVDTNASIYRNNTTAKNNFIQFVIKGYKMNSTGIGTKITLHYNGKQQTAEVMPTRGFQSAVSGKLHFGLGPVTMIDKVEIRRPDQNKMTIDSVEANQTVRIDLSSMVIDNRFVKEKPPLMRDNRSALGVDYRHQENVYDDFKVELLLPHKLSENGPFLATGDVNGDQLEDFYVGGAHGAAGVLHLQTANGQFNRAPSQPWEQDKTAEDLGAHFFDADGDKDLDLYVVSGGNEITKNSLQIDDRLYLNNGKGKFSKSKGWLPEIPEHSGQAVASNDIDGDGDLDLLVTGRVVQGKYPTTPASYILKNEGGKFVDATQELGPELKKIGMVTDFCFVDIDQDKDSDLIVVGEWMPIRIFKNNKGKLSLFRSLPNTEGMWFSIAPTDLNNDGKIDFVVGNLGKNHKYKGTTDKPFNLYANDFDDNGQLDIVLSVFENGKNVPVRGRECSAEQMPFLNKKFPTYESFAKADMETLYSSKGMSDAKHLTIKEFRSGVVWNQGNTFKFEAFPNEAQFAPILGIIPMDINKDEHTDLVVTGNYFGTEVETIRHDAGYGLVLLNNRGKGFIPVPVNESGFFTPANARDLALINVGGKSTILVSNNNYFMHAFQF